MQFLFNYHYTITSLLLIYAAFIVGMPATTSLYIPH